MSAIEDHAVEVLGQGDETLVLMHGFGCDKMMWQPMVPYLQDNYRLVTYDLMGSGASRLENYDRSRYARLEGHADDLLAVMDDLGLQKATLVGHSVSAMTAALAANAHPDRVGDVIMICPSPSFINDGDYFGGFERSDILSLLETLDANYLGWSSEMAPAIMGTPDLPEKGELLTRSFCQTDPDIARHFARVTFLSDHREDVEKLTHRTLVLSCSEDVIVPDAVNDWLVEHIPDARATRLDATGHCPHISFPRQTADAILAFLGDR